MIIMNMIQNFIVGKKIKERTKIFFILLIFLVNFYMMKEEFIAERPKTLYDHFNVSRLASFEEIKNAKNFYLSQLDKLEDEEYEGSKLDLLNYTMTREQVSDSFNILTQHTLKEIYDKYNIYYTENDFATKKGKSFSNLERIVHTGKGIFGYAPFFLIIMISLAENAYWGKKLAITGLLTFMYITFEFKRPNPSSTEDNYAVTLFN
jgi:hypothetical protein